MNSLRAKSRSRRPSNGGRPPQNNRNSNQKKSTIDPRLFVKKAIPTETVKYVPTRQIVDLPVDKRIIENLLRKGYTHPTEIQDKTIETVLSGRDVMGIAQTGTGKTGAFLIPFVHHLMGSKPAFQVLIVVPTRELAVQVEEEFNTITRGLSLSCLSFIGGTSVKKDINSLKSPRHLIIGTPGRLNDLARQRVLDYRKFNTLVLDEFDRLLDMGFSRDIQYIVQAMVSRKQTVLFSATEEKGQKELIQNLLNNPVNVRVSVGNATGDHIEQETVRVPKGENKSDVLLNMVRDTTFQKVLVFAETKRGVSVVRRNLQKAGIKVDEIHGNKSQNYRLKALNDFRAGKIQVLIATDVAARGLDIPEVTHVINYQQPKNFDSYVHRIGRTGRAGKGGRAYTFID
ncbi:MAG: DEAD/DEAH box helicase [Cyclobacteriaceae bacterium]